MNDNEIRELIEKIGDDTKFSSNPNCILQHPSCNKILELGEYVIPFIMLKIDNPCWFVVLRNITGESPDEDGIKKDNIMMSMDVEKCAKLWKKWYIKYDRKRKINKFFLNE